MKGYVVLFMVVLMFLSALPVVLSPDTATEPSSVVIAPVDEDVFTVSHTDQSGQSDIDVKTLVICETAALMPPDTPAEALKAQLTAAYTNFCYQRETADIVSSTSLNFPEGYREDYWKEQWGEQYDANMAVYSAAWDTVKGQTLTYDGDTVMALYHAMNGGVTEDGSVLLGVAVPYLQSVASPADALDPAQLTTVMVPVADAASLLRSLCGKEDVGDAAEWFSQPQKTAAGTVAAITVCGTPQTGSTLQTAFSLPSAAFDVCVQDDSVIFTVSGSGHFVGLSACGAAAMAKDGMTYDVILKHYYTGVVVE